jgi:hypothetical protein
MRLVTVAGACSRSGKTALAVTLLRACRSPAAAVKFTTTDDVWKSCPRGTPCVVCDIDVPFRVIDAAAVLNEPGTDTERLGSAGASQVLWAIARQSAVGSAWRAVGARLGDASLVVIEGSTIAAEAQPSALFFVVHPFLSPARWKPTSAALLARADAVIVNRPWGESREPSAEVLRALEAVGVKDRVRIADVTRPLSGWAPDLVAALRVADVLSPEILQEGHAYLPGA